MKSKYFLAAGILFPFVLAAAVKVDVSEHGAVLDNGILHAQFSRIGAKLVKFTAFGNGKNLTGKSGDDKDGALKDFFAPREFSLNTAEFTVKSNKLPDGSAELLFTSPAMPGEWNFLSLTKKITLAPGSSRLDISVTISNKLERMAPFVFTYWSHNFFGVPGEDNRFIYAGPRGISSTVPSSRTHGRGSEPVRDFTRGFIAMIGTRTPLGVVMLPEFSETEEIYSWYCKHTNPFDTIEFRLIKDKVDNGSSISKRFSVAAVSGLETVAGAGKSGAGFLKSTHQGTELYLTGFETVKEEFTLYIDGKKKEVFTAALAPGKLFKRALGQNGSHIKVVARDFDLEMKTNAAGTPLPLALKPAGPKRRAAVSEADAQWQFDPKGDFVTPHFVWQNGGGKARVLFLVPANGIRDIIELNQRFRLDYTVPTVFPGNWQMSWRTVTDMHGPEDGLNRLAPFLKRKYDAVVIGAYAGEHKARHGKGSWSSYPANLRKRFLEMASQGAGLLIINAGKKDPQLNAIAAKLADIKPELAKTADLAAAPYFENAVIKAGDYGKGKIVLVDFARDAFIAPHPGYRGNMWEAPRPEHRYQEYQFALIGRLLMQSCGFKDSIAELKVSANTLEITSYTAGEAKLHIFDRFSQQYHTRTFRLKAGKNSIVLPALRHGRNYLHVTKDDGSSAYVSATGKTANFIKNISLVNDGKGIEVTCTPAQELKEDQTLEICVIDNLDRLLKLYRGRENTFSFRPVMTLTNRHILSVRLLEKGEVSAEERREFYLPALRNTLANYTNLLWVCGDSYPEYSYFYRYKQYSAFGFNFLYSGSGNNGSLKFIRYADAECGSNGHGGSNIFYFPGLHDVLKKYTRTHDKKDLVRGRCPNDPAMRKILNSDRVSEKIHEYGTRRLFLLGDEMSMTFHQATYDVCMCKYCMADFRQRLRKKYGSLTKLNALWDCSFKSWDEVYPLTYPEVIFKDKRASYVEHRLYMDEVFRRTLNGYRERLRKKYPGSFVGPTGVNGIPSPYGGNFNFYSMKDFDCGSFYRDTRLPVSFGRNRRLVMRYRGYSETEPRTVYSFWEGLALGERSNNNWCGPTFLLPDLRFSQVRDYYSKLLWELRSGAGDLLFHSSKMTDTAAILHSQKSLIINFTKQHKSEFYPKERSFARILEDLGVPYRFIAPEQLDELHKFKVLLLPEASALSDADVEKITKFVKKGGVLIADIEPASFDGLGNKRSKPALDEVFGIDSSSASLRKVKSSTEKDLKITHACRGVKAVSAKSSGSAKMAFGKAPLYLENKFGEGRTLLLNFDTGYQSQRTTPGARGFLAKIEKFLNLDPVPGKATAARPVMHGAFADGKNRYFVLLPEIIGNEKYDEKFVSPFVLEKEAHLYDVRKGKYLGFGKKFDLQLSAGNGTMLAALPYKVESIVLRVPGKIKAGNNLKISAAVEAAGDCGNHVLNLICSDPEGKEVKIYARTLKTVSGKLEFIVPFALNDRPGVWHITIRDAASGVKVSIPIELTI